MNKPRETKKWVLSFLNVYITKRWFSGIFKLSY